MGELTTLHFLTDKSPAAAQKRANGSYLGNMQDSAKPGRFDSTPKARPEYHVQPEVICKCRRLPFIVSRQKRSIRSLRSFSVMRSR